MSPADPQDGVYDITDFIANHPGGSEKILLAAGKSVDAFWSALALPPLQPAITILSQTNVARAIDMRLKPARKVLGRPRFDSRLA